MVKSMKMIPFDRSNIPADKLDDPRLAASEEGCRIQMRDSGSMMRTCVHEAAHAIYMERGGAVHIRVHIFTSYYDPKVDDFLVAPMGVAADFGTENRQLSGAEIARWHVAGGVASRVLIGQDVNEGGDQKDIEDFSAWALPHKWTSQMILGCLEQAKRYVKKDLRRPAFRKQVWDRANEFRKQFLDLPAEPK